MRALLIMCVAMSVASTVEARENSKSERENTSYKGHTSKSKSKKNRATKTSEEAPASERVDKPADPLEFHKKTYLSGRPDGFLIDPQNLLGVGERDERSAFLNYHAGDSAIDLYVYVFDENQVIPNDWHKDGWVDEVFGGGRPAAVVLYHVGKPQRSQLLVTQRIAEKVSVLDRGRAMENAVMQAVKKPDRAGQLQAFLIQMSIRIYWMERAMNGEKTENTPAPTIHQPAPQKTAQKGLEKFRPLLDMAAPYLLPGGLAIGAAFLLWLMRTMLRRKAQYRFTEFEVEPRLGGSHAAGVGAVISFGQAAPPPAYQREQLPEYLRRA